MPGPWPSGLNVLCMSDGGQRTQGCSAWVFVVFGTCSAGSMLLLAASTFVEGDGTAPLMEL
eukprot:395328-Lingulodinium_polyedra.AAC.1